MSTTPPGLLRLAREPTDATLEAEILPLAFAVDYILFLAHDPKFVANPNEVSDTKWVSKADLQAFFQDTSKPSLLPPLPSARAHRPA